MTAEFLLADLKTRGVLLDFDNDNLRIDAPRGAITPELHRALQQHKTDLIEAVHEREERAALQGAPEWCDAALWLAGVNHPTVQVALKIFGGEGTDVRRLTPAESKTFGAAR